MDNRHTRALDRQRSGDLEGAQQDFEALAAESPDDFVACYSLGVIHAMRGVHDEAQRYLSLAVSLRPDLAITHAGLGKLALARGDQGQAHSHFAKALEIEPNNTEWQALMGNLGGMQGPHQNMARLDRLYKREYLNTPMRKRHRHTSNQEGRLGLIQSRGLGDIIIALPIAKHYVDLGWEVHWPVSSPWVEQLAHHAPWVNWHGVAPDHGPFFIDAPLNILEHEVKVNVAICLYHWLTAHPSLSNVPWYQHTSFDKFKYIKAAVPFRKKWTLSQCLLRDLEREEALYKKLIGNSNRAYCLTHLTASAFTATCDLSWVNSSQDQRQITDDGWLFDWIGIIDAASTIVMTDSSFANLTDQLDLGKKKYFVPLHNIQLTPVHGSHWAWLNNLTLNPAANLFRIV